jgi:hypothetical protein
MWDLALMTIFINYILYVNYSSSSQYGIGVLQLRFFSLIEHLIGHWIVVTSDPLVCNILVPMLRYLEFGLTMISSTDTLLWLTLCPNWIWLQSLILLLGPWRIMV